MTAGGGGGGRVGLWRVGVPGKGGREERWSREDLRPILISPDTS